MKMILFMRNSMSKTISMGFSLIYLLIHFFINFSAIILKDIPMDTTILMELWTLRYFLPAKGSGL